ncbi:SemiSWEET transporter [Parvularcula maris]|uniref:SemiSWEET transporter n=1 Tax=Parvularcula maris TaxID=2965077 RepID=A0A9X2L6A1_9PROT|nr:SemiSWEET transporter [Parvularcula maris]MCQ8183863.1 SemiSWEET transporter [Parvularcula maris]
MHELWISSVGAFLTTAAFLPQAVLTIRTRDTSGISLVTYLMLVIGVSFWLVYGLMIMAWPIIIANAVTLVTGGTILTLKILGMRKGDAHSPPGE